MEEMDEEVEEVDEKLRIELEAASVDPLRKLGMEEQSANGKAEE